MLHYQGACNPEESVINKTRYQQECRVLKLCRVPEGNCLGNQDRLLEKESSRDDRRPQM